MSTGLNELSAVEIADGVRSGAFTAESVVDACLARIEARDDTVRAWVYLDPEYARSQARVVDQTSEKGPLAGVPIGVKDIIDTHDMPTGMGSPIYDGHRPPADASCVARLRQAGAIILGKTVTCEFAGLTPRETANPHDPARTPGGSSSGSAAAVADFMVPAAFGTQTGGSVLRPSAYCGVIGYKPSFDTFSLNGVFPAAESLDTLGLHARSLEDIELLSSVLRDRPYVPLAAPSPPVMGLFRSWMWDDAEPATRDAIEDAARRLGDAGAQVRDFDLPEEFQWLADVRGVINARERAVVMADACARHREQISPGLRETVETGLALSQDEYVDAMYLMETCRVRTNAAFEGCDVLLTPAVDGEAPVGLDDTGNPRFQALWTMLQTPTVSLPTHHGPNGLPVGIQLVSPYRTDRRLLDISRWVMEALG